MTVQKGHESVPDGLSEAGAGLWREVTSTWDLRPDERRVLLDACREADLIDRLEVEMRDAPLTVRGSQGQPVAAPAVGELRQHRGTMAALLRQLHLPDEGADVSKETMSAAARHQARARWDKARGA